MGGFRIEGNVSGNVVEVAGTNQLKVVSEQDITSNPGNVGAVKIVSENDGGYYTASTKLASPETDIDYRLRVSQDFLLDEEVFYYTAQNTGKHTYTNVTVANAWTAGNMTTNSANTAVFSSGTGTVFNTYAYFPNTGTQTLSADFECGFSAQPQSNVFIEFGLGLPGGAAAAPTDGVFFRLDSSGLKGVASNNSTETIVGPFTGPGNTGVWAYTTSKKYQFICYMSAVEAQFWMNDGTGASLMGRIPLPSAQNRICMAPGVQVFMKHRITGGSSTTAIQGLFGAYNVRLGGSNVTTTASTQGNRMYGSYQGLSGGTMGSLARTGTITTGNEANVTAAVPTTTTAALGSGLGGTFWETVSLAVNTDGIIMSYQVPAGTALIPGRRLVLRGLYLNSYVQTVIAGGPYTAEWFLAYGHTSVSLATAEAANTKAPRRIALPFVQQVTAAQAVNTTIANTVPFCDFGDAPVFVNPGEFIQVCTRHIGTAGTTGTVVHRVTPVFGWE